MDILIDFDGTVVTHDFPRIGKDIGAVPVLKRLIDEGHNLILFTMRDNVRGNTGFSEEVQEICNGDFLDDAVNWFKENDIPLYGVQTNPQQKEWTGSPKAYGQLHIDDAGIGCPLIIDPKLSSKPFINWKEVEKMLVEMKLLPWSVMPSKKYSFDASSKNPKVKLIKY